MLKVGIIGSGFGLYGLFPAFRSVKGCEVVALCGSKRPQLVEYCERIGFTNIYADWKTMLEREELDAVAIAVTPHAQYEIAKVAIQKGLHVFAEKPLAANLTQAKELLSLARRKKITHGIDFIFPDIVAWQQVKRFIDTKQYGKLTHLSADWEFLSYDIRNGKSSWKTDASEGGGALAFYFSHGLHYLEHFAGAIKDVSGTSTYAKESKNGAETAMNMLLQFANGCTGTARVCCNSRGVARHRLEFHCEKALIVLENRGRVVDGFTITINDQNGSKKVRVRNDKGRRLEDERVKIVRKLAERFVESCAKHRQMSPSFQDGVRVQELIETIRARTL